MPLLASDPLRPELDLTEARLDEAGPQRPPEDDRQDRERAADRDHAREPGDARHQHASAGQQVEEAVVPVAPKELFLEGLCHHVAPFFCRAV